MDHIASIRAALGELDAILLTGESNCFYATGFMGEGVTVVTRQGAVYITDSRYTEAAQNAIGSAAQVWEMNRDNPLNVLLSRVFEEANAKNVGFEDGQMTVAQHTVFSKALPCTLVPATRLLTALRGSKDENEIAAMVAAQRIAEGALDKLLGEITV
ncbi:MAG: aminopeptidase P family N-terminal domain-containing protein, partial [Oscillospiraceae bacterium]|nr:aminopeptidase P family N-terminal domain-containing protein [Oscillospiraceae bacterium]